MTSPGCLQLQTNCCVTANVEPGHTRTHAPLMTRLLVFYIQRGQLSGKYESIVVQQKRA